MKRKPMILMIIAPYAFILFSFINTACNISHIPIVDFFNSSLFVFMIIIGIINLLYPFHLRSINVSSRNLLFWNMLIKLCNIPIYIAALYIGLAGLMFIRFIALTILAAFFSYLLLLTSTMYGVNGLIQAYKEGKIEKVTAVVSIAAHFLFVFDLINAIVMYRKVKALDLTQETQSI